jgi:hypothetical protein
VVTAGSSAFAVKAIAIGQADGVALPSAPRAICSCEKLTVPMGGKGQLGAGPLMGAVDAGRGNLAFTGVAA